MTRDRASIPVGLVAKIGAILFLIWGGPAIRLEAPEFLK